MITKSLLTALSVKVEMGDNKRQETLVAEETKVETLVAEETKRETLVAAETKKKVILLSLETTSSS